MRYLGAYARQWSIILPLSITITSIASTASLKYAYLTPRSYANRFLNSGRNTAVYLCIPPSSIYAYVLYINVVCMQPPDWILLIPSHENNTDMHRDQGWDYFFCDLSYWYRNVTSIFFVLSSRLAYLFLTLYMFAPHLPDFALGFRSWTRSLFTTQAWATLFCIALYCYSNWFMKLDTIFCFISSPLLPFS